MTSMGHRNKRQRRGLSILRGTLAAALIVCFGCGRGDAGSHDRDTVGLLGTMRPVGVECVPMMGFHTFTIGWETLRNSSTEPVTVDSVELTDADGVSLQRALIARVPAKGPSELVGVWRGYPPHFGESRHHIEAREFRAAAPAEDAVIEPATSGSIANLVLILRTAAGGSSGPAVVHYHDADGHAETWKGGTSYRLPVAACKSH
jgi:hypothetical protein